MAVPLNSSAHINTGNPGGPTGPVPGVPVPQLKVSQVLAVGRSETNGANVPRFRSAATNRLVVCPVKVKVVGERSVHRNRSQASTLVRSATRGAHEPRFRSAETNRPVPIDLRAIHPLPASTT